MSSWDKKQNSEPDDETRLMLPPIVQMRLLSEVI